MRETSTSRQRLSFGCTLGRKLFRIMNAIQPLRPPQETALKPVPSRRVARTHHRVKRNNSATFITVETTAKLVVNILLSTAAIGTLVQLLPYHKSVQVKLQEIKAEVTQTEERVNRLQKDFSRSFDPQQAKNVMQEQSHRVDPSRRQIVLLDKNMNESDRADRSASLP